MNKEFCKREPHENTIPATAAYQLKTAIKAVMLAGDTVFKKSPCRYLASRLWAVKLPLEAGTEPP